MLNKISKVIVDRTCPACGLGFTNEIGKNMYECSYSQCRARFDFTIFSDEEIKKAIKSERGEGKSQEATHEGNGSDVLELNGPERAADLSEHHPSKEPAEVQNKVAAKMEVSEEELQHLASFPQLNPNAVIEINAEGVMTYCNPAAQEVFKALRIESEEAALLFGSDVGALLTTFAAGEEHQTLQREVQIKGRFFSESIYYFKSKNAIRIFVQDITERKEIDEKLRLFSKALEYAVDGIQIADLSGRILYANRALEQLCGYPPEELQGMPIAGMNADPGFAEREMLPTIHETGQWTGELLAKHKDGHTFPVWVKASLIRNGHDAPVAIIGIVRESAECRKTEGPDNDTGSFAGVRTAEQMMLESSLRHTIERGELTVYYQPQMDSSIDRIIGAEALVRWKHPELGVLKPERFLPLAEETGFIAALDEWVLRTACGQVAAWVKEGYPPFRVTVNLSARLLGQQNLSEMVAEVLHDTGLGPEWLEIEVSERVAMQDGEPAIANLSSLHRMGVTLSIDNFGTGRTSLSSLKKLPVQRIKIDRSLMSSIADNPDDLSIVKAAIAMGFNLGFKVIAEGVETAAQLLLLQRSGCDEMQGFYFSEPLPADEFKKMLKLST
ncbi:MAG: EAL domain-containing protein [Nitrospirota bacterium]